MKPRHPAAYICAGRAPGALVLRQHAVAEAAHERGWPAPAVYTDEGDPGLAGEYTPALATLVAAIGAGRHDALMVSGLGAISGGPAYLMTRLLLPCIRQGVAVEILPPPTVARSR